MPIQILPARLANQIAAGEVVERPASVVKELVENSLDSGASNIDIEIEKGGHKRILIRDNGSGIAHEELALALSRHATSKISKLDDLEAISSLGFRGEALASISSVSRLTLSSKPENQSQAWQAHCEGRDMEVQLNPVAHPTGSSVEVVDLFFNTPARRKFLRTEKTEFTHIDELLRRIALSRFDVGFTLKHNGKLLRKYPAKSAKANGVKRVAAICGQAFSEHGIELNSEYEDFRLTGWFTPPEYAKPQADFQYFYVNGRMMRDKLINHALRQAFEGVVADNCQSAYVLYLTLPVEQVDVNVHPAKHEVRFHQARIVHDFIFRALNDALNQYLQGANQVSEPQVLTPAEPNHDYIVPLQTEVAPVAAKPGYVPRSAPSSRHLGNKIATQGQVYNAEVVSQSASNYQQLMTPTASMGENQPSPVAVNSVLEQSSKQSSDVGQWLRVNDTQILVTHGSAFYVVGIAQLYQYVLVAKFSEQMPAMQPLLMPVSIQATPELLEQAKALYQPLLENSVEIGWTPNRILLRKVPSDFRQFPWVDILESTLQCEETDSVLVCKHLLACISMVKEFSNSQCHEMWLSLLSNEPNLTGALNKIGKMVPMQEWVKNLS
ncbi:DNA mismatch repair endonuclease MutL [Paraglaciecola marina]|uniref:DNA mismatch repair endonuclease MutL n=1 Tax=Paraglaciecola marina TaxID=2500157 RepID=UPI0010601990|nr:DNA mismatch repair endonuclease MutL [Paraglaciecola marina]